METTMTQPGTVGAAPAWADPSGTAPPPPVVGADQHEAELFSTYSTLDEPVRETIMRDVHAVATKLRIVIVPWQTFAIPLTQAYSAVSQQQTAPGTPGVGGDPNQQHLQQPQQGGSAGTVTVGQQDISDHDRKVIQELKDWDLWGPLIVCLGLAVILSLGAPHNQASLVFAAVFCVVWVGSTIVTINAQLLGSHISFFQSLCVLGYCIFPLLLAAIVIVVFKKLFHSWLWFNLIFVCVGYLWATRASSIYMGLYIKQERRLLALYPIFFFYTFLGWLILLF